MDRTLTRSNAPTDSLSSRTRQVLRGFWRLAQPAISGDRRLLPRLPTHDVRSLRDWRAFTALGGEAPFSSLASYFDDWQLSTQSGRSEYFIQDVGTLKRLGCRLYRFREEARNFGQGVSARMRSGP